MKTRPVGDHALLVLVDDARSAVVAAQLVHDLGTDPSASGLVRPRDVVPAARTVLLDGLPGQSAVAAWRERLADPDLVTDGEFGGSGAGRSSSSHEVTIETTYEGADLEVVAEVWGCSPAAVVERHQRAVFLVAFCGFAPGFAYCLPTQPLPEVPRRDVPRERVPSGSVGLAGEYCGVYPVELPGGWQLVGRTSAVLFDPGRDEPALLAPGDTVRFRAVP